MGAKERRLAKDLAEFVLSHDGYRLNREEGIEISKAYIKTDGKLAQYHHTPQAYRIMHEEAEKAYNKAERLIAKQEGMVLVPEAELKKLEKARIDLYELLAEHLSERIIISFTNITGQIWRVANTKNWYTKL